MVFMDTTEDIMTERIMERSKTSGRTDDNPEAIKKRLQTYMDSTMPIIKSFEEIGKVVQVDASKDVDDVFKQLQDKLSLNESA